MSNLVKQFTQGVISIMGFMVALEILDATALLAYLVGAVGLLGLAIDFAIQYRTT